MASQSYQSEISRRYARALYQVLGEGKREQAMEQLSLLSLALGEGDLQKLVNSPALSKKEKLEIVDRVEQSQEMDSDVLSFVKLLVEKDRVSKLGEIARSFEEISDRANRVLRGEVVSSSELSDPEKEKIEKAISDKTQSRLVLDYKVQPGLVGGVCARVGSYTFDGALATQLKKLKEQISEN